MASNPPDDILAKWQPPGPNDDIFATLRRTFNLPSPDGYVYRADAFSMTLAEIEALMMSGQGYKYIYRIHNEPYPISSSDITAYTSIFAPTTFTDKALAAFGANAKKASPRAGIAAYLASKRRLRLDSIDDASPSNTPAIPRSKSHINPYFDVWVQTCHLTGFCGPLSDPGYQDPQAAKLTHPVLPLLYHHFGCVVPTWEALNVLRHFAFLETGEAEPMNASNSTVPSHRGGTALKQRRKGHILDIGSGSGFWTYMLRRLDKDLSVIPIDNCGSAYRTMWTDHTIQSDGPQWLRHNDHKNHLLLMVYPVTEGSFTEKVIKAYRGSTIAIVGTQNANRYTAFPECTVEEWFERNMPAWNLHVRIALPSFAGKDEALYVWRRS